MPRRRDCPSRLRSLLRNVTLLAAWCERTLERDGFTPGQVAAAARKLVVQSGRASTLRWRLKTEGEIREEQRQSALARGEVPPVTKPIGGTYVLRDPWEGKPPRFPPKGPRRKINTCDECELPIGVRAEGEAHLCVWCARRREMAL